MDKDNIKNIEARIEYLEENRRFIQNSLEMALSLGDFHEEIGNEYTPYQIFEETEKRIKRLIKFEACAFYLVDPKSSDLTLSICEPDRFKKDIEDEIEFFIEEGFVAWAIRERRGVSILSRDQKRQILLHVIATRSKIRGMFIGAFPPDKDDIPDASLELLSLILRNTANALGSIEYHEHLLAEEERIQKEKLQGVIEMAGAVCHELNQPLQVVYGYSDLLLMSMPEDHPDHDSLVKIREQTERIKKITEKLMTITKYETKKYLKGRIIDIDRASEERLPE